jgi:murein L,D-transpeptidase YafK
MKVKLLKIIVFSLILFLIVCMANMDFTKAVEEGSKIDKILVVKHERKLYLLHKENIIKSYRISLGRRAKGKKEFEGDGKTPEGVYYIDSKNPNSNYYKNLGISYPNEADKKNVEKAGRKAGGLIKIHGMKNGLSYIGKFHRFYDWTEGCIALTDKEMDEIYEVVEVGTEIEIIE